jgi:hypothetical protein
MTLSGIAAGHSAWQAFGSTPVRQSQAKWPGAKGVGIQQSTEKTSRPSGDRFQSGSAATRASAHPQASPVAPRFAGNWFNSASVTHGALPHDPTADVVFRPVEKTNADKLAVAQELSTWMLDTLREKDATVAVIARNGPAQVQQHDATGMAHSGIAVYDPQEKTWHIHNLINHVQGAEPQAGVWKTTPLDFFYEQSGYKKDALILIPPKDIQKKMADAVETGQYKPLFFTRDYNLVSAPHTPRSLNCNKWSLMNVMAAHLQNYHPPDVLAAIRERFKPAVVNVHPVLRPFAKQQPIIIGDEVPVWAPIHTVSVESLYHSGLFEDKQFFSQRQLEPKPPEEPASALSTYGPVVAGGLVLLPLLGYAARNYLLTRRLLSRR